MTATPRKATAATVVPDPEHAIVVPLTSATEPRAANVIEALLRVMRDLPAIGKTSRADESQGGYAYRGIEAITMHTQVLFARHGVLLAPHVESWERDEVLVGRDNKVWHDERLRVTYDVYGPGGIDDHIIVGPFAAVGRDGSDKGTNKCMTQAMKYLLLQVLCISDKADDADGTTVEAEWRREPDPEVDPITRDQVAAVRALIRDLRERGVDDVVEDDPSLTVVLGVPILERDEHGTISPRTTVAVADDLISRLEARLRDTADTPAEA